jgi:hypothetical protein
MTLHFSAVSEVGLSANVTYAPLQQSHAYSVTDKLGCLLQSDSPSGVECWDTIGGLAGITKMSVTSEHVSRIIGNLHKKQSSNIDSKDVDFITRRLAELERLVPFVLAEDAMALVTNGHPRLYALRFIKLYVDIAGKVWAMAEDSGSPTLSFLSSSM